MEARIDPSRVRTLMERKGIRSARKLAEKLGGSERTVRRLLRGELSVNARALRVDRLASVLDVEPGVLTGEEPMPEDAERDPHDGGESVRLNVKIGAAAYNALILNVLRYGVAPKTQVELAALLFHIVAQRSLRHRREALAKIYSALEELEKLGETEAAHLPKPSIQGSFVEDAYCVEEESIEAEDIFAEKYAPETYYPDAPNPFQAEIERLASGLSGCSIVEAGKDRVMYLINPEQALRLAAGDKDLADAILQGFFSVAGLRQSLGDEKTEERVAELHRRLEEYRRRFLKLLNLPEEDPGSSACAEGGEE